MLAPQSSEEIRPVVEALRRLDPLLDIRWNEKAVMMRRGDYDVLGGRTDPVYDGRWDVIRYDTATKLHDDKNYTVLCTITEPYRDGHGWMMRVDGPYGPIGMWLVEYMQRWDTAQAHFAEEMDRLWAEHDAAESINLEADTAANQQALEKVYREHGGGEYWIGRGIGPGPRATADTHTAPAPSAVASSLHTT
jgi:hypothetical protein